MTSFIVFTILAAIGCGILGDRAGYLRGIRDTEQRWHEAVTRADADRKRQREERSCDHSAAPTNPNLS